MQFSNKFFLFIVICCSLLNCCFANGNLRVVEGEPKLNVPDGEALHYMEKTLRVLTKNPDFKLGNEFRDEKGDLLKRNFRTVQASTTPTPPAQCAGSLSTATYNGITMQYNYQTTGPICIYMEANMAAVNANYDPSTKTAATQTLAPCTASAPCTNGVTVKGIQCNNCYGYIGADLTLSMSCTLTGDCNFAVTLGGGIAFNMDFEVNNPSVSASFTSTIYSGTKTELFTADGITIYGTPSLNLGLDAQLSATGTASIQGGFETTTSYEMSAVTSISPASVAIDVGFSGAVSMTQPKVSATSFQLVTPSAGWKGTVSISPIVEWTVSFGISGCSIDIGFTTPVAGLFDFSQSSSTPSVSARLSVDGSLGATSCTSSQEISVGATLTNIGATVIGVSYPFLTTPYTCTPVDAYQSAVSNQCLVPAPNTPTMAPAAVPNNSPTNAPSPTAAPTSNSNTNSDSSSDSSTKLSTGELAAVIILPVAGVLIGVAAFYYFYFAKKSIVS